MSEAISVSYTTFQDPTFPAGQGFPSEAAFLGSEIPFSQKPFLYFTQPFNITDLPLKLLSSEMKSHFLRTRSVFHTTFQDPTFPWQLELSAFLFLRHFWTSGFSLWKLESCGDSSQNQESFFLGNFSVLIPGSLSLLLLCLILLMVSGMSILLLIIQAARKETGRGPGRSIQQSEFPFLWDKINRKKINQGPPFEI